MSTPWRPTLERLRYWQGQTLRSADARDQQRFDALRRRLHNRALHATGGVAFGLAVAKADGHRLVEVACGMAYDAHGREIILQRARRIAMVAGRKLLMLRLSDSAVARRGQACCAPADAGCATADARLLDQDAQLAWGTPASFQPAREVILAIVDNGTIDAQFVPKQARPIARPRLATGVTVQGDTPWEPWVVERPDGKGGILSQVVGVQTHVDTSASGFTQRPRYVASLQAPSWDLGKADFAPAFLSHVAEPAADGFTFRLLMTAIARRRYNAWSGIGRVASIDRGVGDRLLVEVDPQASFKVGDMVAQLRPRAASVVGLEAANGDNLTLAAALPLKERVTLLAVANLPRMASVVSVPPEDPTVVAAFKNPLPIRKGDLLQRASDGALAVVDSVSQGRLKVGKPFAAWTPADTLMVARMAAGADVKSAAVSADGAALVLELKSAPVAAVGMDIVLLNAAKLPLAATPKVESIAGNTIEVRPAPPAAEIAGLTRVVPLAGGITIESLQTVDRNMVEVDTVSAFDIGDFVVAADEPSNIAVVADISEDRKQLELSTRLNVKARSVIVAANWQGASTVDAYEPKLNQVTVGRANAALAGDFVALRAGDGFATAVSVAGAADKILTLKGSLAGVARLDTLAIGRFPRIATVVALGAGANNVTIAQAGALNAGDCVIRVPAGGAPAGESAVVQVVSAAGAQVVLSDVQSALAPGDLLATLHWRDQVLVKSVDPAVPTRVVVEGTVQFRQGDVVGVLDHYADCSNPGYVETITGNVLMLAPGLEHGEGIVDQEWIDGGIVGPAAVSLPAPAQQVFPAWQPFLRLDTIDDGLDDRTPATAYGLDLLTGQYQSRDVLPLILDRADARLVLFGQAAEFRRFRPEKLSLITGFNTDFPRAFATFARKQQLVVRWIGCQQEFVAARSCPAQTPHDACVSAAPATSPEDP